MKDRSTGDILILMVAGTICFSILATGAALALISILQPARDLSRSIGLVSGVVNTLVGLLAGFLVGRNRRALGPPTDPPDGD